MTATNGGGRWDAIVIGAGVNGLVAAHYLARAGRRVVVVERQASTPSVTETGWVPPQLIRELDLERRGLHFEPDDPWISAPLPGGGQLELSRDMPRSVEAIRRISPADAARWPEFCERMRTLASVLERLYVAPPPDIETRDPRELLRFGRLGLTVRRLGKQTIVDLARILPMSVAELLDDWFENDTLKGLLGAVGVWHLQQGPRSGGTAFNFLHHHVGSPPGVFRPPRSNITQVLSEIPGVEVLRGQAAVAVAGGVVLGSSGDTLKSAVVISSADPRRTFEHQKPGLDADFVRAIDNVKCRGVVSTATIARDVAMRTLCIAPSLEYLERAYDAAKYGKDSEHPYVEVHSENGRLVAHIQYTPFGNSADSAARRTTLKDAVLDVLAPHIPDIKSAPWTSFTLPDDLDSWLTEGNLYHGELTLDQILFMRPVAGWSRYRTPVPGLYLCGAGTHPGGGIAGAAGRNAAGVILKETKRS